MDEPCQICREVVPKRVRLALYTVGSEDTFVCEVCRINLSKVAVMMREAVQRGVIQSEKD